MQSNSTQEHRIAAPLLSVLTVNYNGLAHLDECLSSVVSQNFTDFEIVLVDNASRDGSVEFVRKNFPDVRVIETGSNLGFAGGNNAGLPHCRGEHVFFLNNDTRLESGALAALADAIRKFPSFRVFACFMLNYRDPSRVDNAGEVIYSTGLISGFSGCPADLFREPREVIGACGGAAVFSKSLLDEIGGFDEDFFLLFEDLDLSLRARHHGERILFLPDVRVHHKGSASIGGQLGPVEVYFTARNYLPLFLKNFPAVTLAKVFPGIAYSLLLRTVQVLAHGQFFRFLRGLWHGAGMLPRTLRKRREIFSRSRIDRTEFERLFRPGWFRERLAVRNGDYSRIP